MIHLSMNPHLKALIGIVYIKVFYCCQPEGLVPRYLFEQESQAKYVANHIGVWDDVFERDLATNHSRDFL